MHQYSRAGQLIVSISAAVTLFGCDSAQVQGFDENELSRNFSRQNVGDEFFSDEIGFCEPIQIDVSGTRLHGKTGSSDNSMEVQLVSPVPAGDYHIRLHYEDEYHPNQSDQLNEQWYVELLDASGNNIATTVETSDLPGNETVGYTDVGSHSIATDVHTIKGVHAVISDDFNSIQPTMVEFYTSCGFGPT